jgi:hypothetical protein
MPVAVEVVVVDLCEWASVILHVWGIALAATGAGCGGGYEGDGGVPGPFECELGVEAFVHAVALDEEADCKPGDSCAGNGPVDAAESCEV